MLKSYILKPGPSFSTSINKQETELTSEMIANGSWKTKQFKAYNLDALGTPVTRGHLHPLLKVRTEFRNIFLEMGFTEMPTNNFVESSFWNFDALFQPQQHPARDAHDTFFISDPSTSTDIPDDYMERVKRIHSVGVGVGLPFFFVVVYNQVTVVSFICGLVTTTYTLEAFNGNTFFLNFFLLTFQLF